MTEHVVDDASYMIGTTPAQPGLGRGPWRVAER